MRLYTPRLCLRPPTLADASRIGELAGDVRVATATGTIPHPYPAGTAEKWLASLESFTDSAREIAFAITLAGTRTPGRETDPTDTGHLIGIMGISRTRLPEHARAELFYWMGFPYWNKGFATEAGRAVLAYAFTRKDFHRVTAGHFVENPASGRVMEKLGMTREGILREHYFRDGVFHDVATYGILHEEWAKQRQVSRPRNFAPALQPV